MVARLVLAPVLIAQAVMVRRRARILPEAAGAREGRRGRGPALRLHIVGDSSAAGVGVGDQSRALAGCLAAALARDFDVRWSLDAQSGATTQSTLDRLRDAAPARTDVVITALGVNDVTRQVPPRRWVARQRALRARLHGLYAPRFLYVCGLPPLGHFPALPNPLRWVLAGQARALEAALLRDLATDGRASGVVHVPFAITPRPEYMAADGFHPSAALYALWAQVLAARIRADFDGSPR